MPEEPQTVVVNTTPVIALSLLNHLDRGEAEVLALAQEAGRRRLKPRPQKLPSSEAGGRGPEAPRPLPPERCKGRISKRR